MKNETNYADNIHISNNIETNNIAIVTGASRGIGKAIALDLAKKGYTIALLSRHFDEIKKATEEIKNICNVSCYGFECDVTDKESVKKTFQQISKLGKIKVLVNNAGINSRRSLQPKDIDKWWNEFNANLDGWNNEIAVNLTGAFICSYIASGYMLKHNKGAIINISSIKGKEATSSPGYGASKGGIIKLTKDFAKSLAPFGIRVNCIAPGFINTGMTTELSDEKKVEYKKMIPQARFGETSEVAKVASFLASDDSSYITGATIDVNGGYLMD